VEAFLPQLASSNAELLTMPAEQVNIEHEDDEHDGPMIEMVLTGFLYNCTEPIVFFFSFLSHSTITVSECTVCHVFCSTCKSFACAWCTFALALNFLCAS
jgi:hypothetical protein